MNWNALYQNTAVGRANNFRRSSILTVVALAVLLFISWFNSKKLEQEVAASPLASQTQGSTVSKSPSSPSPTQTTVAQTAQKILQIEEKPKAVVATVATGSPVVKSSPKGPSASAPATPSPSATSKVTIAGSILPGDSINQNEILKAQWPPASNSPVRNESTFVPRLGSMLIMLLITCALIWGLLKLLSPLLRRLSGSNPHKEKLINVLERQVVGPGKAILLVKVDDIHLVLGMTDSAITPLAQLSLPAAKTSIKVTALKTPEASEDEGTERITDSDSSADSSEPIVTEESEVPETQKPMPEQAKDATQAAQPEKNLVQEVLNCHLSSLPFSDISSRLNS